MEHEFCAAFINVQEQKRFILHKNGSYERTSFRKKSQDLKFTGCA